MRSFFVAVLTVCTLLSCLVSCHEKSSGEVSVTFDTITVDSVCTLFRNYDKPACHIAVSLPVPAPVTSDELRSSIERFITLLPKDGAMADESSVTVSAMVDSYVHQYLMDYLGQGPDAIASYGEDMDAAATWMSYEEIVTGEVVYNTDGILSYQVRTYSYTGGAHGSSAVDNGVFDIKTLTQVTLSNVFAQDSMPAVNQLLRQKLAAQYECASIDELVQKDLFFSVGEIEATENFMVNADGISWMFDPCDIAPFSMGEVQIALAWQEVAPFLLPDTPLLAIAKK